MLIFAKEWGLEQSFFSFCLFACVHPISSASFIEKTIFPPFNYIYTFVKNQLGINMWVCFWVLYSISLSYVSVSPIILHSLSYCNYIVSLEIRYADSFSFVFLFKNILNIFILLLFHIHFRKIILSFSIRNLDGILIGIVLDLC